MSTFQSKSEQNGDTTLSRRFGDRFQNYPLINSLQYHVESRIRHPDFGLRFLFPVSRRPDSQVTPILSIPFIPSTRRQCRRDERDGTWH